MNGEMESLETADLIKLYLGLHVGACSLMCDQRPIWFIDDVLVIIICFQIKLKQLLQIKENKSICLSGYYTNALSTIGSDLR